MSGHCRADFSYVSLIFFSFFYHAPTPFSLLDAQTFHALLCPTMKFLRIRLSLLIQPSSTRVDNETRKKKGLPYNLVSYVRAMNMFRWKSKERERASAMHCQSCGTMGTGLGENSFVWFCFFINNESLQKKKRAFLREKETPRRSVDVELDVVDDEKSANKTFSIHLTRLVLGFYKGEIQSSETVSFGPPLFHRHRFSGASFVFISFHIFFKKKTTK